MRGESNGLGKMAREVRKPATGKGEGRKRAGRRERGDGADGTRKRVQAVVNGESGRGGAVKRSGGAGRVQISGLTRRGKFSMKGQGRRGTGKHLW